MCGDTYWLCAMTEYPELRTLCENTVQSSIQLEVAVCQCQTFLKCSFYCTAAEVATDVLRMQLMRPINSTVLQIKAHW